MIIFVFTFFSPSQEHSRKGGENQHDAVLLSLAELKQVCIFFVVIILLVDIDL